MKRFFANIVAIGIVLVFCAILGAGIYGAYAWPRHKVTAQMEAEGYTDVVLSHAFINRAPYQCGGDDVDLYTYTARINQRPVTGFACYRGWLWGVAHWDN